MYHGQCDKYRVTVPKVVAFIDYWTGKDRSRPLFGPFSTLQTYIGTGLTHLMFLQEAVLMSLQQLQDAEYKKLIPAKAIHAKLHNGVQRVAALLKNE